MVSSSLSVPACSSANSCVGAEVAIKLVSKLADSCASFPSPSRALKFRAIEALGGRDCPMRCVRLGKSRSMTSSGGPGIKELAEYGCSGDAYAFTFPSLDCSAVLLEDVVGVWKPVDCPG